MTLMLHSERERDSGVMEERDESVQETLVSGLGSGQALLGLDWHLGGLLLYNTKYTRDGGGVTGGGDSDAMLVECERDASMSCPVMRTLYSELYSIFSSLQQQQGAGPVDKKQLVEFSRSYRSVMRATMEGLQKMAMSTEDHIKLDYCKEQVQALLDLELIWNLCEVLFVEAAQAGLLVPLLLDWVHLHGSHVETQAQLVLSSSSPGQHPQYWDTVLGFVLQGRIGEARQLLSHTASSVPPGSRSLIKHMDTLLKRMPFYTASQSLAEFDLRWRHWQEECQSVLREGAFASHQHLELLCKILAGEEEALMESRGLVRWYGYMVARLLYSHPTAKPSELQHYVQAACCVYGNDAASSPLDQLLQVVFDMNLHQLLKDCSLALNNWWFVAHLSDLLHHCQQLQSGTSLREFLLLEFATNLMAHHSLWSLAPVYLDACGEEGRAVMKLWLVRLPLQSERKAQKVLRICQERNLQEQARGICKEMAVRAVRSGRLGLALNWSLRAKDPALTTALADRFLDSYAARGAFCDLELIDSLGSSILLSDRLTFLGKYREFHRLYGDRRLPEAARLLLTLMTARVAPTGFWLTLLGDAVPLLTHQQVIFDAEQSSQLLDCLEEAVERSSVGKWAGTDQEQEEYEEKKDLIRMAIVQNLARAIVGEGSLPVP
ncbi:nuclear pore complex protein Nup85 isoform X2 [Lethenteron reissneri]|uniref:nuclear pore complex protein Nup85 isoform X2 n=2 Tax=Lethenteron reissneri TaxID=7753 RepID=UPI002AB7BF24|nr:nuclear pore complex protein Nup85 isoform X2 [Lethenteron reissneri]